MPSSAVAEALREHGERYLERVYTTREVDDCRDSEGKPDPERLASRFAAKEAALKALRPDGRAVPPASIEVVRDELGVVTLELRGAAAELAETRSVRSLSLSLTHDHGLAVAVVVADCR